MDVTSHASLLHALNTRLIMDTNWRQTFNSYTSTEIAMVVSKRYTNRDVH